MRRFIRWREEQGGGNVGEGHYDASVSYNDQINPSTFTGFTLQLQQIYGNY